MDADQIPGLIVIQTQEPLFFPVFEGAQYVLFRMIELVRNIGHTGSQTGVHHAEQIKINFQLGIIGIFHILVNEQIGHRRGVRMIIRINCQSRHEFSPCLSKQSLHTASADAVEKV